MTDHDGEYSISGGVFFSHVIQGHHITVELPPQITPAMAGLPPATPTFTGRDSDLITLLNVVAPGRESLPREPNAALMAASVGGMGGVGKTELAIQAARTALARGWFPGGVLFVDMFGYDPTRRLEAGQALEGFLRAVGIPGEHIPPETQARSRLFRSVLATYANESRRVLVIADNVSTSEQARPLLPSDGTCAAIVTSRHTLADLDARLLNLDILPTDQAVHLLTAALSLRNPGDTRIRNHAQDAHRVAEMCGGLPLALQIVVALLAANPAKPLAALAGDLADTATRLEEMAYADGAVRAVFDTSYHQLPDTEARLFRLLSANPGPDIATTAAAVLAGLPGAGARRSLEALARAHLIESSSTYGRWRMHDLIRLHSAYLGHSHGDGDQRPEALTRLMKHYLTTVRAACAHLHAAVDDPARLGFPTREQALAWLDAEYPNLTAGTYAAAADPGHLTVARDLPSAMWHFLLWRRHFNDWISLSRTAFTAAQALHDQRGQAVALGGLGAALQGVRRFDEAITVHQQQLQICQDVGDRHGEGQALGNLGLALREAHRFKEAITAHQDAAQIFRDMGDQYGEEIILSDLQKTRQARAANLGTSELSPRSTENAK
jgi:tetratricopeptide (TPR) repeat protein